MSFTLTFVFYSLCFELRMLPTAWNIQDSPFLKLWPLRVSHFSIHIEIKSCRIENNIWVVEVYRNIMTWPTRTAARTKDSYTKRLATTCHACPHLAFRSSLLKPFREFGLFGHEPAVFFAWPCYEAFCARNSDILGWTCCVLGTWSSIQHNMNPHNNYISN